MLNKTSAWLGKNIKLAQSEPGDSSDSKKPKQMFVQWMTSDERNFFPASEVVPALPPGYYEMRQNMDGGLFFHKLAMGDEGLIKFPETNSDTVIDEIETFWEKEKAFRDAKLAYKRGILLYGPPGCHAKGTEILMSDGHVKKVEDIVVGDALMGPDSKPRRVLELRRGKDEMYKVVPCKGEPFVVNGHHVLSLTYSGSRNRDRSYPETINMSVNDFLSLGKPTQERMKLRRSSTVFKEDKASDLPIEPYFLGVWLGDGTSSRTNITTADPEIEGEIRRFAQSRGLEVTVQRKRVDSPCGEFYVKSSEWRSNSLLNDLRALEVFENKHIPQCYLLASREQRLELLAGIIDTDGCYSVCSYRRGSGGQTKKVNKGIYDILQVNKLLASQILWLARSLGFGATSRTCQKRIKSTGFEGEYVRIFIGGSIEDIPVRIPRKKAIQGTPNKNCLLTGIREIHRLGIDDYYGFTLSDDHLYLTNDFFVHHNSGKTCTIKLVIANVVKRKGIVIRFSSAHVFESGMNMLREVQPETPVVVLMEDIDSILSHGYESDIINILDGVVPVDKLVFLACYTPNTRLLTRDLRWVPAGEMKVGDELWGLDENRSTQITATGRETARRFRASTVMSSFRAEKECVRVYLKNGESFVCTVDHPWLSYGGNVRCGKNLEWTMAKDLMSRPKLVRTFMPWTTDTSYEAGWLAGMMDGEGHIKNGKNIPSAVGLTQSVGPTADKMMRIANKYGDFTCTVRQLENPKYKDQVRIYNTGGFAATASILGTIRPERLIEKFDLTGGIVQANFESEVVMVEPVGMQEIQSIETSSRTYFAEGFASHNTTNYPEKLGARIMNRPSRFDKRFEIGMPNNESREIYLKKLVGDKIAKSELDKWVTDTQGLSIAHLKELVVAVTILGNKYADAIKTLRDMRVKIYSEEFSEESGMKKYVSKAKAVPGGIMAYDELQKRASSLSRQTRG